MSKKQQLELTWVGKGTRPRLEPRILLADPEKSYRAAHRIRGTDIFDNRLIFGDNLLALKALEQEFASQVKCVYIDPPFNTQQALEHYEDGLKHSLWLSLMRERLELLHRLMSRDGSLFVHIDDNELGYLIAVLDEIFGRVNRISVLTFKQGSATGYQSINPGVVNTSNFILLYAKDKAHWRPNRVFTVPRWAGPTVRAVYRECGGALHALAFYNLKQGIRTLRGRARTRDQEGAWWGVRSEGCRVRTRER